MKRTFLETIKSWRTSVIGYGLITYYFYCFFRGHELNEYILITGLGFIVSKDFNTKEK